MCDGEELRQIASGEVQLVKLWSLDNFFMISETDSVLLIDKTNTQTHTHTKNHKLQKKNLD